MKSRIIATILAAALSTLTACGAASSKRLEARVSALESDTRNLDELEARVDAIDERTAALVGTAERLDAIESALADIHSQLAARGDSDASLPDPLPTDELRPPTASDLDGYVRDLPGQGPLMATFDTSAGTIHCTLYGDETPMTVANFVGLARGLKAWRHPRTKKITREPLYDGVIFHRVIPDFMIQTGDPIGTGSGWPGYKFDNEIRANLRHDKPGILSMANSGPGTNGSQFFITETATPHLMGKHTVFGHCRDIDIIKKIARVDAGPRDRPTKDVTIRSVTISRGP
ncbi:peptidylprolyl isomerase [Haliangium ochraceum]|uniref:Peptidyl-prolyl cis-trans isomerase n=1 Tax=Haliangium ochraceum (strain DSM 14365 / JCM 11303 / SMP-2) TaxID=502025 RepID=D0LQF2_HALO1|nr:peptidylprolyl isomerase [Haliangium ochraceum]ACY18961.1 Peptidylprolyl isomerase [Haliangium ochraceum DSM 14365]